MSLSGRSHHLPPTLLKTDGDKGLYGGFDDIHRMIPPWNRPILVTGTHRSGSTWVGRMIASHWRVKYYSEPLNPESPGCPARQYFHYVTEADEPRFLAYLKPIIQLKALTLKETADPFCIIRFAGKLGKLAGRFMRRGFGGRPLLKDPMALLSAEWLARRYQSDTIVLIRHPAAFASSLKRLNWHFPFGDFLSQQQLMEDFLEPFRKDIERFARTPPDIVTQAILLWRILHGMILRYRLKHPEWTFVRHEDLSARPHEEFAKLFRALGLGFSARAYRTIAEYTDGDNPVEAAEGAVHQLKRDSLGNIWNWTQRLNRDEVLRIRRGTEEVARHFYSAADWSPPIPVTRKVISSRPRLVLDGLRAVS